jgi:hypothetical protein
MYTKRVIDFFRLRRIFLRFTFAFSSFFFFFLGRSLCRLTCVPVGSFLAEKRIRRAFADTNDGPEDIRKLETVLSYNIYHVK